jgi:Tfp pilus assembly protein PilN
VRPVNLIPADDRRSSGGPIRTGPIAYLLVGALVLGLGAVTLLVLSKNTIADHKAEIANLKQQEAAVSAQAQQFSAFTNFKSMQQSRQQTVASLADSRFDWERIMRELSRVIPSNVWLDHLSGSATGGTSSSTTSSDPSITGPSLQISGCATGQDAVAGFLAALRDIDGVTRVGLTSSARPGGGDATGAATADSGTSSGGCATKDFIAAFQITVAFDNAPSAAGTTPTTPTTTAPTTATPASTTTPPATTTTPAPTTPAPAPTDTGTPAAATTP